MMDCFELYEQLKTANSKRSEANERVAQVRRGQLPDGMAEFFPSNWPAHITANMVDTAARDMGEVLGELPTVRCRPASSSDNASQKAARRTKIALGYIEQSGLQRHMYAACDRLVTFTTLPFIVEPDFEIGGPVIRVASSRHTLFRKNLRGEVIDLYEHWTENRSSLEAKFPDADLRTEMEKRTHGFGERSDPKLTVVKHYGRDFFTMFVPERGNEVLMRVPNPLGKVPAAVVETPRWDDEGLHGTYDNAIWVQLARSRIALMTMEAMDMAIHAPIAIPPDVNKVPYGPGALIPTQNPDKIRRVQLDVPREAWVEAGALEREERMAARYPEGRSGNIDASVITGQGVQALLGTIDSIVKTMQTLIAFELRRAVAFAFEMDEKLWGNENKTVTGELRGKKFEEPYRPNRDIAGDYSVEVTYGLLAGLDPNRATVMMLQLLGGGLVDKTTVMEQLPFGLDVDDVRERLDREAVEESLRAGVQSMLANVGMMAQSGQDPTDLLVKAATLIEQRERGKSLTEAVLEVFKQEKPAPQDPFAAAQQELAGGASPEQPVQTPAQPGGGRLMQMLSGLTTAGNPQMSAQVMQRTPAA